jgi:speckle-type POZ protein
MLSGHMQEARTETIEIVDFTDSVVHAFVRFLYSDACSKEALREQAWALLAMGDKYAVSALVALCETHLSSSLSTENVVHALVLADTHGATWLRSEALRFIQSHAEQLAEEMENFPEVSAELFREILRAVAAGSKQKGK